LARGLREVGFQGMILLTTTSSRSTPTLETIEGITHQYLPLDHPGCIARFLDHWAPDVIAITAGDLWPTLVGEADRRGIPVALVSAGVSARTARRWAGIGRPVGRTLFPRFRFALTVDETQAARLGRLGVPHVEPLGCLKASAPRLPVDPVLVEEIRRGAAGRPIVAAASTHRSDEAAILDALAPLDALTVVAPRYPDRFTGAADVPRRSRRELPSRSSSLWLADSFGDLGSLFEAADVVVMGGSFGTLGGHNAAEPARFGRAIVTGPDSRNNAAITEELRAAGGLLQVGSAAALETAVADLLEDPSRRSRMGAAAAAVAAGWDDRRRITARRVLTLTPGADLRGDEPEARS
jgi:3-deoxy-D-manno-octulosonic-acid transferase